MQINVKLLIFSNKWEDGRNSFYVLLDNNNVLSTEYKENDIMNCVNQLLTDNLEVKLGAYTPMILDVLSKDNTLDILYGLKVPYFLKPLKGGWVSLADIIKEGEKFGDVGNYQYIYKLV